MADADSEFKIKAVIDPSGAKAGADQVVSDLNQVKGSTDDTADSQGKLGDAASEAAKKLSGLRTSHEILRVIRETSMGGTEALMGEAGAARVLAEVVEGVSPEIAGVITTVIELQKLTAILAPHDSECATLLHKLAKRVSDLTRGDLNPQKLRQAALRAQANLTPEDAVLMVMGGALMLKRAADESITKKGEYVEQRDSHTCYVRALEERCKVLLEALKAHGHAVSQFAEIPKPE